MKHLPLPVALALALMLVLSPAVAAHEGGAATVPSWLPFAIGIPGVAASGVLAVVAVILWRSS